MLKAGGAQAGKAMRLIGALPGAKLLLGKLVALPTQGTVAAADRAALRDYAIVRDQSRQKRLAARAQLLWTQQGAG